jgi:hypothetical protein
MNTYTEDGACELAYRIERYWRRLGHETIMAWIEPISLVELPVRSRSDYEMFMVKSNLVNGLPPQIEMRKAA